MSAKAVEVGGSWTALVDLENADLVHVANTIQFNVFGQSTWPFPYSKKGQHTLLLLRFLSMNLFLTPLLGDRAAPTCPWDRVWRRDGEFRHLRLP